MKNFGHIFSQRAILARTSPIDELFKQIRQSKSEIISFAAGAPDISLLPVALLNRLNKQAIQNYGQAILQYGFTQGFPQLRQALKPLLLKRGIIYDSDDMHISTGGSGGLNNVCMAVLNKGDIVLVETPSYEPAIKTFLAYEAHIIEVVCDKESMVPDDLGQKIKKYKPKLIYLLPTFQNPTGRTMSLKRRKEIAALVKKYNILVIEDDVYFDLRYKGEHVPALYSLASQNVIYLGSVSKIFAPAMRVGFVLMPQKLLQKVLILKQGIDMQTSSYTQALVTEFLKGDYEKHIQRVNKVYARKLEIMLEALAVYMPKEFVWDKPEGGLFLWIRGLRKFSANSLLTKAVSSGVAFLPGNSFYVNKKDGKNEFRLNFASPPEDKIEKGVKILSKLCK